MAYYRCGPTAIGSRTSWGPVSTPSPVDHKSFDRPLSGTFDHKSFDRPLSGTFDHKSFDRPLSGTFDRIFNSFERTNAFEYVKTKDQERSERQIGHGEIVVNRKMSSSFERADCALAAQTPCSEDEEFYREKILYSQARQLFPLQEDLADWINKTIGITYLTGENFLDVLDNGAELCQLAAVIHDKAREAIENGLIVGPVPQIRGRCWQRAARRSFFSRDNTENFITFCRDLGVHENLLFESDDLVLHNQPRQVILCLLEVARLATKFDVEPPGLVALEKEIALEERDSGLDSAMSGAAWQFRTLSPTTDKSTATDPPPDSPDPNESQVSVVDNADAESTKSEGTVASTDSDVPLKPTNELDKRVQLVTRLMERGCSCSSGKCSKLLKVKKVGEGRYNIAGRNVFIRLLKGRHMMVRVGGGWDTLEHFLSRHEPCQVRLVAAGSRVTIRGSPSPPDTPAPAATPSPPASLSGKASPRTSTPVPKSGKPRSALTLPLRSASPELRAPAPRTRKQSAPSFCTPNTPTATGRSVRTPPQEYRKSLTSTSLTGAGAPSKSRSMSLATNKFCGTDRLNQAKSRSATTTPTEPAPRKTRSQSLATTPLIEPKKLANGTAKTNGFAKKARSMSLAATPVEFRPINKNGSVTINGALTQAAIEETIRMSLAATIADERTSSKPFLHIKAKYRSPPPREVPPR